jgi:hypothetical protein
MQGLSETLVQGRQCAEPRVTLVLGREAVASSSAAATSCAAVHGATAFHCLPCSSGGREKKGAQK